jgi:tRNA pseudouridine38-40 synthase
VDSQTDRRFKITLHYDGSQFFGWQIQKDERTVQGELEHALERLTGERRTVTGSGRTDRGVHALGQVGAFTLPDRWEARELIRALNAVLPSDIWVEEVRRVPDTFHPRYDAVARTYDYRVGLHRTTRSPFHRGWCWPLARDLPLDLLQAGSRSLLGNHSFAAFAKAGQEERGDRCTVSHAGWYPWEDLGVLFRITANRYLHHMVRYLVGTMVEVALGRRPLGDLELLLKDGSGPLETSPPAPPEGLFLKCVEYPVDADAVQEGDRALAPGLGGDAGAAGSDHSKDRRPQDP